MRRVLPGLEDVYARGLRGERAKRALRREDLPTLERPRMAISGRGEEMAERRKVGVE